MPTDKKLEEFPSQKDSRMVRLKHGVIEFLRKQGGPNESINDIIVRLLGRRIKKQK